LPADGTWARYAAQTEAEFKAGKMPARKLAMSSTLTVSCVGAVTRHEQKCRWIELKVETEAKGAHRRLVLKMLIPEEYLRRGRDPLAHAVTTFFNPKPADRNAPALESFIDEGFNRIQYEVDRFRNVFPKPLDDAKALKNETVKVEAGEFKDCEVIAGTSHYDGPLLNDGRSVHDATYKPGFPSLGFVLEYNRASFDCINKGSPQDQGQQNWRIQWVKAARMPFA
jgi:hypothetical protein